MFFKIAFRNLWKRKVFTTINIFGLSLGLSACLIIYLYISDELDYDNFYPNSDRLVRIVRENGEGGERTASAVVNYKLGELAKVNLTQIRDLSQFSNAVEARVEYGGQVQTEKVHYTDNEFFSLFGVQLVAGNEENIFKNSFEAALTVETARRVFGEGNAVGELIRINDRDYKVVAVVEGMPKNSHLNFDYLLSIRSTKSFYGEQMFNHWGNLWIYTYALLNEGTDIDLFDQQLAGMVETHGPPVLKDFGVRFYSQPVESIHLHSQLDSELKQNGDVQLLRILGSVALLILIIACFNFINLTTARSAWRSKEVGVKKVLGIKKHELIRQFLGESILTTMVAFVMSLLLVLVGLPFFNQFADKQISLLQVLAIVPALLTAVVIVGAIAGIIPAVFLSSFQSIRVLKGQAQGDSALAKRLRHVLIVLQFSIAIGLIIGTLVIFDQLHFIKNRELGVNLEDVVVLRLKDKPSKASGKTLLNALRQSSYVREVSLGSDIPFENLNSWRIKPKGENIPDQLINIVSIDNNYLRTLEIGITDDTPSSIYSWDQEHSVVVNESFVRHFLIAEPIGSEILINHIEQPVKIVGVVKDYHFASLHESIRPLLFYVEPSWYTRVIVKINNNASIGDLESIWKSVNSDSEFDYFLLKDRFENLYATEEKTGSLVAYFSFFSLLIASMGLYGLAAYVAESKLKEISVRKILGAGIANLVQLQFNVFLKLIGFSAALSVPIAIWAMGSWLNNFAYNVGVSWIIILFAVIAVLIFTIISVGYRSLVAAFANPVDNLRNE